MVRAQSLLTLPHPFIPFCIYLVFAAPSMQPFKVAFPADISIKPLGNVTSFSIYLPFEMRISENAKYDFKVLKLHHTSAFSHTIKDRAFLLPDPRCKNRLSENYLDLSRVKCICICMWSLYDLFLKTSNSKRCNL